MLLDAAKLLKEQGVNRFIVAGNDHRFARVATLGQLHVLTLSGANVSQRLKDSAETITILERGDDGWHLSHLVRGDEPSVIQLEAEDEVVSVESG